MNDLQIGEGYDLLGQTGDKGDKTGNVDTTLPLANALLVLYQTNRDGITGRGLRYKELVFNLLTSHVSAANGFKVDETWDKGVSWQNLFQFSVTVLNSATKILIPNLSAPDFRVSYQNGAVNTSAFQWALLGDRYQRGGS